VSTPPMAAGRYVFPCSPNTIQEILVFLQGFFLRREINNETSKT